MVACTDALYVITTLTVGQENNARTRGSGVLKIEFVNKQKRYPHKKNMQISSRLYE